MGKVALLTAGFLAGIGVSLLAGGLLLEPPYLQGSMAQKAGALIWEEVCPSCHNVQEYGYTFDTNDYAFLAYLASSNSGGEKSVLRKAPHGPYPSCESRYRKDAHYSALKEEMPDLRRDTFESFLLRNDVVAVHKVDQLVTSSWDLVTIVESESGDRFAWRLSRVGFSADGSQALIYTGQVFLLFAKEEGGWRQTGRCLMWIS